MWSVLEPYVLWFKLVFAAILLAASFSGGVYVAKSHYQKVIADTQVQADKQVQAQQAANVKLLADNAALTRAAEVHHASNQSTINSLTRRIASLSRMRIHIPTGSGAVCAGGTPSPDSDGTTRILSDGVDEGFARLQERVSELVQRCDQLNIDAIQMNESLSGK